MAAPFAQLHEQDFGEQLRRYVRESKNPDLVSSGPGSRKDHLVEVIGAYSKLSEQGKRLRTLREMRPEPVPEPIPRKPKQAQKRLRSDEIDELITAYRTGITIQELASRHGVHRTTVMHIVERAGEPRR